MMVKVLTWVLSWCVISAGCAESYNIALSNSPANLNPFSSYDSNSQNINRLVHLSLVDLSRQMTPECNACEKYDEEMTSKGYELHFVLKRGLRFWDGEEVDAPAVKQAIELYQDEKEVKSLFRKAFSKIKKVEVVDKYRINLIYEKFDLDNLTDLTLLKILKLKKGGDPKQIEDIVGAGHYRIIDAKEMRIELDSQDGEQRFIFKVVKDETTLALKMLRKEIDISLANLSPRKIEWLKRKSTIKFKEVPSTNLQYLALNNRNELLAKKKFREVIYHVIPKKKIIDLKLKNTVINAPGFFPPGFPEFYADSQPPRSLDRAKQLMLELGAKYKEGKWFYHHRPVTFNWLVVNNKASIELTRIIKDFFERFGIGIAIHSQEWGSFYKNFKKGKFDILMSRWIGFTGPSILRFALHSDSFAPKGGNRVYFSNHRFDHLLDIGLQEINRTKRIHEIKSALKILDEQRPYIYLWYPKVIWAMQRDITVGALYPNTNFVPLERVKRVKSYGK